MLEVAGPELSADWTLPPIRAGHRERLKFSVDWSRETLPIRELTLGWAVMNAAHASIRVSLVKRDARPMSVSVMMTLLTRRASLV